MGKGINDVLSFSMLHTMSNALISIRYKGTRRPRSVPKFFLCPAAIKLGSHNETQQVARLLVNCHHHCESFVICVTLLGNGRECQMNNGFGHSMMIRNRNYNVVRDLCVSIHAKGTLSQIFYYYS